MRRVLWYEAGTRAAQAAATLREAYELRAWPGVVPAGGAVVLIDGAGSKVTPDDRVLAVALVGPEGGPWPEWWHALVPVGAPPAVAARTVRNAFAALEGAEERARLEREMAELHAIGIRLTAEPNPRELLETILTKAREITEADAGSLYLVEESAEGARRLRFALAQNDSIAVPFTSVTLPLTADSVAGHVALTGRIVNLADAYAPPADSPFTINRWFDEQAGYRTRSMLVVPMRTPQGETIGALQLINCTPDYPGRLASPEDVERHVHAFGPRHEKLAGSLASQAAVAVSNRRLYLAIRELFEGFVKASVTAIEARDPTTSGHSFRVADLTVGLAEAVHRCETGPYGATRFSGEEMTELRYAALLHDFGKVGVREHVLVKAKKLYPADLDRIRHRVELLKRDLMLRVERAKRERLRGGGADYESLARSLDTDLARQLAELDAHLDLIVTANEPAVLAQDFAADLRALTTRRWEAAGEEARTLLTPEEAGVLSIPRGSLTDGERREIQEHVVHTFQFLRQIPWTRDLGRVPEIARSHHEKLDGSGYPRGVRADQIPLGSRMMAIADIYDALTASDRPYKKALQPEQALDVLDRDRRAGGLDGALLDLFVAARVFERTAPGR
jgi:HD-GYP domain-containing protein (c-di-GMP phosphodiesterase class II)